MTFSQPFAFPELEPATEIVTVGASPRTRAEDIIRRAHQEAERIAAEAAERGRREGHAAGVARAREELEPLLAAVEATAGALDQLRASVLAEAERRAVELAIALADKIVSTALEVDPSRVLSVVTSALRHAVERDRVVIEVSPDDLDVVRAGAAEIASRLGGITQCEVVADRRVARGGCVVRTVEGEIDARISEQLARAGEVLREALTPTAPDA